MKKSLRKSVFRTVLCFLLLSVAGLTKLLAQSDSTARDIQSGPYGVSLGIYPEGSGTVSGGGSYSFGDHCHLNATANIGYKFQYWKCGNCEQIVSHQASYTFTVGTGSHNHHGLGPNYGGGNYYFCAFFSPLPTYNISVSANPNDGGSVNGGGTFYSGTTCTLTATPNSGFYFIEWTKNGTQVSTNPTYSFTVKGNASYVAHFSNSYSITAIANPSEGGIVTGADDYIYGSTCTLSATANTGYTFSEWTKNDTQVSTNPTYSFTVTGNASYVAHFSQNSYSIAVTSNPTEGGNVTGGGQYFFGDVCTLSATSNSGYSFVNWTENEEIVSTEAIYSFTVTGTKALVANFEESIAVENITFADVNVNALCVANWDTNGDGELSYDEAAAVTDLGTVFRYNSNITSFDELQFFTGLNAIGLGAFSDCINLTSITIPNSVTSIGAVAFLYCPNLASITIPDAVTSIGRQAFSTCGGLSQIIVGENNAVYDSRNNCNAIIETATNNLIAGCKNTVIPNSVTSIGEYAFWNCSDLTSIEIPISVVSILKEAFEYCSRLTSIVIPDSVNSIGDQAFGSCSGLNSITIGNSVSNIGFFAFQSGDSLSQIIVGEGNTFYDSRGNCNAIIETATNSLVWGCKNTVIPNSVTSIGYAAFAYCSGLTSIEIPNAVTTIGDYAFYDCYNLTSLTVFAETPPVVGNGTFFGMPIDIATITIPCGTLSAYHNAEGWNEFINYQENCQIQTLELKEGWNWISTYIEAEDPVELLQMLEAALGENASQISSAELFTDNYEGDWWGDLEEEGVTNEQMYMILVETPCTIELEGVPANTADHAITINPGWNWIGFPCDHEMTIEEALGSFDAEEGDVFANSELFTEFDGEWFGDVETLLPGQGFMYYSNSEETKTLIIGGGK